MDPKIEQYRILLNKSKSDLSAAQILFNQFKNEGSCLDLDIVMFHLQQSIEKSFKAYLSKIKVIFPKTHDLEHLNNLILVSGLQLPVDIDILYELNDYAVEGRYATILDDIEKMDDYFLLAENIFIEITNKIN
jgi:HEPN domain-containing protein